MIFAICGSKIRDKLVRRKSARGKITARARTASTVLFSLVLIFMTLTAALIIRGIGGEAARNRARAYAVEAAQIFYSYFSEDLTLVRKAAFSQAIGSWSANEQDDAKRIQAFYEMMDYAAVVPQAHLYLGISDSGNEYRITRSTTLDDFVPVARLNPAAIDDAWYFKALDSENDFTLNIGLDTVGNTWRLWINHKVFFDGEIAGIFCSGLNIPDVFRQVFPPQENIRGYIINRQGVIQLASAIPAIYRRQAEQRIRNANAAPEFTAAIYSHLESISGFFTPDSQPEVFQLSMGGYRYAAIAPIVRSDWSVVVLYDSHFLSGMAYLLPLFVAMVVALFLYVAAKNFFLNKQIFTPINRLTASVHQGAYYDSGEIYGSERDDEIGELARTILDAGLERQQMVREINEGASRLEAALGEARAASEAKSSFLANMSHEMRTPLNAVIGLSELTLQSAALNETVSMNLEQIYNAGKTLLSTVNDILDISKIEAGRLGLVPVEYDIPSLINDAINQSIMRIEEKPITFILDIDENLPARLYGDDLRIKQVLNNLLSNAFKYTKQGTVELHMICEMDADDESDGTVWMTIRVSDSGIGIRKENIANLFLNYAQIDTLCNRKIEGTGLGLPIAKRIAEMMGGCINVESEYGKGSVFTVRLRQQAASDSVIGAEVADSLKRFRYLENKRRQHSRRERIKLPYARVLLVDDVAGNLDVAKGMMKLYGIHVDCVTSGDQAVNAVRAGRVKYNAIFMDHMMPVMDGIEAVNIIRNEIGSEYAKTVPIIALTANAIVGNDKMFLSNGFQAFISKPIEMDRLDEVLKEWVQDTALERALECVNGLDTAKGVERFGGDCESYFQALRSYASGATALLEKIQAVNIAANCGGDHADLTDYTITVHGIKGSSFGICAAEVGNAAAALEQAAREGNIDFILSNNAAFIETVRKLAVDIEEMLGKIPRKIKQKKDKPDLDTLEKLLAACKAYDMDGVDAAMAEIENCEYTSSFGNDLAVCLRENINQMNFTQVQDIIINVLSGSKQIEKEKEEHEGKHEQHTT